MVNTHQHVIRFDGRAFQNSTTERFVTTLFISMVLHAFFILGTYFKAPNPAQFKSNKNGLDVVLVNSKSAERPRDPKVLAQANVDGGGNTDENRRAKSPLPTLEDKVMELEETAAQLARAAQLPASDSKKILTAPQNSQRVQVSQADALSPSDSAAEDNVQNFLNPLQSPLINQVLQRTRQISHLEAQISKDFQAYQQRPKRKFVGASAAEYKFAGYVEDWRQRIEEVGNQNYPEAARQNSLYGSLLITVAVRLDGSLDNVEIIRSSGNKVLDAAAMHIVELAAPYSAFPLELRNEADVLHITRTWTFTKSDKLISE
jgi:periplasmic protein TonB